MHGGQNAAMEWFEPITGLWPGARHDHAHGVIQVGLAHLSVYVNLLDISGLNVIFEHIFTFEGDKKDTKDEFCDSAS
jgi:hypothetical protein